MPFNFKKHNFRNNRLAIFELKHVSADFLLRFHDSKQIYLGCAITTINISL